MRGHRGCGYCPSPQSFLDLIISIIPVFIRIFVLECRPLVKGGGGYGQSSKASANGGCSVLSKSFNMASLGSNSLEPS